MFCGRGHNQIYRPNPGQLQRKPKQLAAMMTDCSLRLLEALCERMHARGRRWFFSSVKVVNEFFGSPLGHTSNIICHDEADELLE